MQTQPVIPVEQADSSLAEQKETATINEADRTDDRVLDRSEDVSLVPAPRSNDQDTGIPEGEPADHAGPQPPPEPPQTHSGPVGDRSAGDVSGPVRDQSADVAYRSPRSQADYELLELGKTIATKLAMRRKPLIRQALIDEIRRDGGTISTDRASQLLRWIKEDQAAPVGSG
jgi:hypothetical protein